MFTGIIRRLGVVVSRKENRLVAAFDPELPLSVGDSVSVNGCCLTVTDLEDAGDFSKVGFDLSGETLTLTTLGEWQPGKRVNIEQSLRAGMGMDGHLVQGHVDVAARVVAIEAAPDKTSWTYTFGLPVEHGRLLAPKGSVAVDGISLTVVAPRREGDEVWFDVAVIPHTQHETALQFLVPGERANVEFDIIAKQVDVQIRAHLDWAKSAQ